MCQLDATLKVDIGVEKGIQEKLRHFIDSENFIVENTFLALPKWCHYIVVSNFYCDFAYDLNSLLTKNENYIIIN